MAISVFDLFSIGIGPSSTHTVGPMRAASRFAEALADDGLLGLVAVVRVELFGSFGATGHGHGSVTAVILGLEGERTELVDPTAAQARADRVVGERRLGRVVTAPTNGAAGIIPAVLHYYARFVPGADDDGVVRFLLTAAAVGMLFKQNASIWGADVGCRTRRSGRCARPVPTCRTRTRRPREAAWR